MNSENVKLGLIYIGIILTVWGMGYVIAKNMSDYEVISPQDGIECVIVSRMFNTSVDCWVLKE